MCVVLLAMQALRLDKFSSQVKTELKFLKEKLEAIEEDRSWLERQLKQAKKSNKLMKAELEVRMRSGTDSTPFGDSQLVPMGDGGAGEWTCGMAAPLCAASLLGVPDVRLTDKSWVLCRANRRLHVPAATAAKLSGGSVIARRACGDVPVRRSCARRACPTRSPTASLTTPDLAQSPTQTHHTLTLSPA